MTTVWLSIALVAVANAALKAAGPALLGQRELPPRARSAVALLAPAVLASLVVTQTFGTTGDVTIDARVLGLAAAGLALAVRAPALVAVLVAVVVVAIARAIS